MTDRSICTDCGRVDVPVNKDGSLRKHRCKPAGEPSALDATSRPEPDQTENRSEVARPSAAVASRSPYCRVPRCTRPALNWARGLCGAHWSTRRDLAEV